jgi:hypothetical protein
MADSDCKKRKVKALPIEIEFLTDEDRAKFDVVLETDSNPKSNTFVGKKLNFDLKSLTVNHLYVLCTNVDIV